MHEPESEPSESGGEPGGAGPPEDAGPPSHAQAVLENTPASTDPRVSGNGVDEEGNPTGGAVREYRVTDKIDEETGHRIVQGQIPVDDKEDADAIYEDLKPDLQEMDEWEIREYLSPLGGVTTEEVQQFYEDNPDLQPEDEDGEAYIPTAWNPSNHELLYESSED